MAAIKKTDAHGNFVAHRVGFLTESQRGEIRYQQLVRRIAETEKRTTAPRYVNENPEYKSSKLGESESQNDYRLHMQDAETGKHLTLYVFAIVEFEGKRVLYPKIVDGVEKYPQIENGVAYCN